VFLIKRSLQWLLPVTETEHQKMHGAELPGCDGDAAAPWRTTATTTGGHGSAASGWRRRGRQAGAGPTRVREARLGRRGTKVETHVDGSVASGRRRRETGRRGGKRRAGRWRVRGRRCGGETRPRLGRRGTAMDLTASGHLRHRIDLVAGSLLPPPQHPFGGLDGGRVEPGGERRRWRTR